MTDRFLLDTMLGTLATYLRMCGYDAAYALDEGVEGDEETLAWAREEERTLVTRSRTLARRVPDALLLESREVEDQLAELSDTGLDLSLAADPSRCGVCNAVVEQVPPDEPTPEYAPNPADENVWRCPDCGQHFWKGSHWDDVAETLADL